MEQYQIDPASLALARRLINELDAHEKKEMENDWARCKPCPYFVTCQYAKHMVKG